MVAMKNNGFTLLEIIIVLTLVTLVLGLSTVYFAGYLPSVKLDATGREMAALIRQARSQALLKMETQSVMIDLDDRSYGLGTEATKNIPASVLVTVLDPFYGELRQGKFPLVFHPVGGGEGRTIILSAGKKKIRIDLDPITGAVKSRYQ